MIIEITANALISPTSAPLTAVFVSPFSSIDTENSELQKGFVCNKSSSVKKKI
jgi:hypothetical protein